MNVLVVLGSTREGRLGDRVGKWVQGQLSKEADVSVEIADLAALDLPMYHDAKHPAMMGGQYSDGAVTKWSKLVSGADAILFVTPEYNHSIPAPLKNAIDWLYGEWANKAAGIVGYSATPGGGVRAAVHLRDILGNLQVADVTAAVQIPVVQDVIKEDGTTEVAWLDDAWKRLFDQVKDWSNAMKTLRQPASKN